MTPEARWWKPSGQSVQCLLCPHECVLKDGRSGICGARSAEHGAMALPGYGRITAEALDPVEKKPLYHFHPGETVWSVGFTGCNLSCPFCQNHRIAQAPPELGYSRTPGEIIGRAVSSGSRMLAYTYSEPTVHIEFLMDCAQLAAKAGLRNILVTNGMLNREPAGELLSFMDAANIDLKSWNAGYYRRILKGNLPTVLDFISAAAEKCWVEITNLVVPDDNDDEKEFGEMVRWIASLSPELPLHLSAYHPSHHYSRPSTSPELLGRFQNIALKHLKFVYLGNLGMENDTFCPDCGSLLIQRHAYTTRSRIRAGACPGCGRIIPGVFPDGDTAD